MYNQWYSQIFIDENIKKNVYNANLIPGTFLTHIVLKIVVISKNCSSILKSNIKTMPYR